MVTNLHRQQLCGLHAQNLEILHWLDEAPTNITNQVMESFQPLRQVSGIQYFCLSNNTDVCLLATGGQL